MDEPRTARAEKSVVASMSSEIVEVEGVTRVGVWVSRGR